MDEKEFNKALIKAIAVFSAGVKDGTYEWMMDDLTAACTNEQWKFVCETLDEVNITLAATDKATPYQIEFAQSKRTGKPMRSILNK